MRLLFVSNLFPPHTVGGYEQNCSDIAKVMRSMGHEVDVITSTYGVAGPVREPNVWRVLSLRRDYGTARDPGQSGVGHGLLQVDLRNVRAVRSELRRVMPDVTMLWGGGNLGPLPSLVAEAYGPTVYHLADEWLLPLLQPSHGGPFRKALRRAYREVLGVDDRPLAGPLVFVSGALRERYRSQNARVQRSRVNHLGIDPDLFQPQVQAIVRPARFRRILFAGRVEPRKGTTTLVRAFARLQGRQGLPELRLTLVGPATPEYESELRSMIDSEGLRDNVTIRGPAPRAELPRLYSEHDVFAFPSQWLEPFALTPLEAMACAIPVVSSLAGGSSELVRDGDNAVTFDAGDAEDLANKLAWVLTHQELAAEMGRRASEEVRSKYTLWNEAEGLLAAVSEAVPAGSVRPKTAI